MPVHQAKFHLDKLEARRFAESEYARLGGRRGPGAGRPAKLYRRSAREISVSLPDREYELAGQLMADAIAAAAATGDSVIDTLYRLATVRGRSDRAEAAAIQGEPDSPRAALSMAVAALTLMATSPPRRGGRVVLVNCPFHRLAQTHTQLVCGMNHALVSGLTSRWFRTARSPASSLAPADVASCWGPAAQ